MNLVPVSARLAAASAARVKAPRATAQFGTRPKPAVAHLRRHTRVRLIGDELIIQLGKVLCGVKTLGPPRDHPARLCRSNRAHTAQRAYFAVGVNR